MKYITTRDNSAWLRERFVERLLALSPASVLDVGAGEGTLVRACRAAGVRALGVEPSGPAEHVLQGDATALPVADAAFDWVTFRHVPHHLEDPRAAFAEAWRVARVGLLIGDPGYAVEREDGRLGLEADRWLKRRDRARGMFHADVLSAETIEALLPEDARVAGTTFLFADRAWAREDLEAMRAESTRGVEVPVEEEREWALLVAAADEGRVGMNGTTVVEVRRDEG